MSERYTFPMADDAAVALNIMLRSARNNAIEDCIAVLRPTLMQDTDTQAATIAGRAIEKMRALKIYEETGNG